MWKLFTESPVSPGFCVQVTSLLLHTQSVFQITASMFCYIAYHSAICLLSFKNLLRSLVHCFFLLNFLKLSSFKAISGRNEYKYLCLIHHFNLIFTILNGINFLLFCCQQVIHYLHDDLVSVANVLTLKCLHTAFGSPDTESSTHFYCGIPL